MPADPPSDVKFEIGHVLFIDIVGYSKSLIHGQSGQFLKNYRDDRDSPPFAASSGSKTCRPAHEQ